MEYFQPQKATLDAQMEVTENAILEVQKGVDELRFIPLLRNDTELNLLIGLEMCLKDRNSNI